MSDKPDAWMPLYIGDWDGDTGHLTNEQDGAYGRLIRWYWRNGPLPDDDAMLASLIRADIKTWRRLRPSLQAFFVVSDGRWNHKRADAERERWAVKKAKASERAEAAAKARWAKGDAPSNPPRNARRNARSMPEAMLEQCPSSSSTVERDPSGSLSHSGRRAPTSEPKGSSPPAWTGPADVRALVVAKCGEAYAVSWLDPCGWQDVPERLITARTTLGADRLWRDFREEFQALEISIGKRAA